MTPETARAHLQSFHRLPFNQVFRRATQDEVKNGVQLAKTFVLAETGAVLLNQTQPWAWMTLAGVIKHAMQ